MYFVLRKYGVVERVVRHSEMCSGFQKWPGKDPGKDVTGFTSCFEHLALNLHQIAEYHSS
jgi:hypothetical protein